LLIKEGRHCGKGLSKTLQINLLRENCMHKLLQAYNLLAVVTCTAQNLKEFENCSNVLFFKPNTILLLVVSDNFQWRQPHESKDCLPQKLLHWAELHTVYIVNLLLKVPKAHAVHDHQFNPDSQRLCSVISTHVHAQLIKITCTYSQYALSSCLHWFHILKGQNKKTNDVNTAVMALHSILLSTCTAELAHVACFKNYNVQPSNFELYSWEFHKLKQQKW